MDRLSADERAIIELYFSGKKLWWMEAERKMYLSRASAYRLLDRALNNFYRAYYGLSK